MFEQAFRNIDDILRKEAGCTTELDYTEQTSWLLFLKYLDGLEQDRADEAALDGKKYSFSVDKPYRWETWAAPKRKDGRFHNFKGAFYQLASATLAQQRDLSELEQQGMIQAFEFTHELAWNVLKDFLESRGTTAKIYASKDATREAFATGLIENGGVWMEMIDSRNKSTHTYDCTIAEKIGKAIISSYVPEFEKFQKKFAELERKEAEA